MKIDITKKSELTTSRWSGGTTTQLAIFPKDASYEKKDFQFRLSTAEVEVEKSTFTSLPGISRVIMILKGTLELQHTNRYTQKLEPFETDAFEGDWETSSVGQVTDFNLMMTPGTNGNLSHHELNKGQELELDVNRLHDTIALYAFSGAFEMKNEKIAHPLEEGDLLLLQELKQEDKITLKSSIGSTIVVARINTSGQMNENA